jgi:hypothetical protein
VGIVVGTTALNGPVLEGLRRSNSGLISDKRALESDVRALQADVDTADDLVRARSGALLGGALDGQRVLLVRAPGADGGTVQQIGTAITDAGGAVTGSLALEPALVEPGGSQLVEDLVASVLPAGVELPEDTAVGRAGAVLAAALLVPPGESALARDDAQQIVSAFEEAGLVDLSDAEEPPAAATVAVLVAGPAPTEPPTEPAAEPAAERAEALQGLLELSTELDARSAGLVLAGPAEAAVEGGLVRELRADAARDALVSTVDNADRAVGQVAVALALREQAEGGVGRYGSGQGASAPLPPQTSSGEPDTAEAEQQPAG